MPKKPLKSYRELVAWQLGMRLVDAVHLLAKQLRGNAKLASQLENAAMSVPANIAEGYGRASRAEYSHFLSISLGSLREVETFALVARRRLRDPAIANEVLSIADRTGAVLFSLRRSLAPKNKKGGGSADPSESQ